MVLPKRILLAVIVCWLAGTGLASIGDRREPFHTGLHSIPPELRCDGAILDQFSANRIIRENCLPGSPSSEWDVNGAGDPSIQGFSTDISYNLGSVARFKIDTDASAYRVDIFRLGFYQGLGARHMATVQPINPQTLPRPQVPCRRDKTTMMYDCAEWEVTAEWPIPADAVSGVYIARLVRTDGKPPRTWREDNSQMGEDPRFAMPGGASMRKPQPQPHAYGANGLGKLRNPLKEPQASLIYFVVRNDTSTSDIVFQTSDTVWQAYNMDGGTSTYGSFEPTKPQPRCYKASLNRPLNTRQYRSVNAYLGSEYPISRFLEANGYDVTYVAAVDTDRYGRKFLPRHRLFLSTGHDEYWSGPQRSNVEWARSRGVHIAFLSGNEMFWRVRWEDNYRTMVIYKESQSLTKIDPITDEWTGTWRDGRDINPLGPQPENSITGQIFTVNAWRNDPLIVPFRYSRMRQWRHTSVAKLQPGESRMIHRGILGHEIDEDVDNGFRPPHLVHLSETEVDNVMYVTDHGSTYDSGSATHHLVLYKNQTSGAIVFGAGTAQWGWALDGVHDSEHGIPAHLMNVLNTRVGHDVLAPNRDIQQFTVNLFGDMGVHPTNLDTALVPPHHDIQSSPQAHTPSCSFVEVCTRPAPGLDEETAGGSSCRHRPSVLLRAEAGGEHSVVAGVDVRFVIFPWPTPVEEKEKGERKSKSDGQSVYRSRWFSAARTNANDEKGLHWQLNLTLDESRDPTHHQSMRERDLLIEQWMDAQSQGQQQGEGIRVQLECVAIDDALNSQAEPSVSPIGGGGGYLLGEFDWPHQPKAQPRSPPSPGGEAKNSATVQGKKEDTGSGTGTGGDL